MSQDDKKPKAAEKAKSAAKKTTKKAPSTKYRTPRLYMRGVVMGYKRGLRNQYNHTALIKINDIEDSKSAQFYIGKKIAYVYKASTREKIIWGKGFRTHGSNGVIRAKFKSNLPGQAIGRPVKVMLYPSTI